MNTLKWVWWAARAVRPMSKEDFDHWFEDGIRAGWLHVDERPKVLAAKRGEAKP